MLFWIICGGLALVAAALVALPLLRTTGADDGPDRREVEIYRAQLAEIDRDIARGVITGEEAERTRTEVARRLLAADAAAPRAMAEAPRGASFVMAALAVALVAGGGIALYGRLGVANASGPFPDIPRAARIAASEERSAARISQEQAMETVAAGTPAPDPEHLALVERLRAVVA